MRFQRVDQLSFVYCPPRSFLIYGPDVNRKMKAGDEFIEFQVLSYMFGAAGGQLIPSTTQLMHASGL